MICYITEVYTLGKGARVMSKINVTGIKYESIDTATAGMYDYTRKSV